MQLCAQFILRSIRIYCEKKLEQQRKLKQSQGCSLCMALSFKIWYENSKSFISEILLRCSTGSSLIRNQNILKGTNLVPPVFHLFTSLFCDRATLTNQRAPEILKPNQRQNISLFLSSCSLEGYTATCTMGIVISRFRLSGRCRLLHIYDVHACLQFYINTPVLNCR